MNVLIIGTGRCRTGWAHKVLRMAGMPITHQGIRHAHANGDEPLPDLESDVSFEATPIARVLNPRKLILLVRDPAEVVRSWLSLGVFFDSMHQTHNDWWRSMKMWSPEVCEPGLSPVERATRFYIRWNHLALLAEPDHVFNVETLTADMLGRSAYRTDFDYTDPGVVDNGTPGRVPVALSAEQIEEIRDRAARFLPLPFDYTHRAGLG